MHKFSSKSNIGIIGTVSVGGSFYFSGNTSLGGTSY